ncbi:conjugal transfer protein TraD [Brucella pituitosa]|uniref:conjugal transfer protein TraD n=1 Tax=Brucella pituitosa TaxID=571256 RepID=UPI000C2707D8|nr:conjugal transfer protein TraD [Brucella pituitosa]PJO49353.1 conjugal transfer protein TraD [Brucella pituitosa]
MERRLLRLVKNSASDKTAQRKQDARQKIELGRLVIKAGLRHADKAFILGALMEAAQLPLHSPERQRLTMTGRSELATQGKHE